MSYQTARTIAEAIHSIQRREYVLPAIQREFVWNAKQIERLFDSLMRDYPISTFLFWKVGRDRVRDYQFYQFLQHYHERKRRHNDPIDLTGDDDVIAILDGQQRLTSMYISLTGTYAEKKKYLRRDDDDSYPEKRLFLNLLAPADDIDQCFDFQFLSQEELAKKEGGHWFPVADIMGFETVSASMSYIMDQGLADSSKYPADQGKFALETLNKLWNVIHEKGTLSHFMEESPDLEKVLQIFIRINSGGTKLSYSDLLLSIATAQWENLDAREVIHEFVDEINRIGNGFEFSKDFVLKSCLVLSDIGDIKFKVENFTKQNMSRIESEWNSISSAIKLAVKLCARFGFNKDSLRSTNAVIPIAYYLMKGRHGSEFLDKGIHREDRDATRQWLSRSLIKHVFSQSPDSLLATLRGLIQQNPGRFPLSQIIDHFKGTNRSIMFTKEDVDSILEMEYRDKLAFTALALLYPSLNFSLSLHIDHIHPRKGFHRATLAKLGYVDLTVQEELKEKSELLPNLQFLHSISNTEKSGMPFEQWLSKEHRGEDERASFMTTNHIPLEAPLGMKHFREFFTAREAVLRNKLMAVLGVSSD